MKGRLLFQQSWPLDTKQNISIEKGQIKHKYNVSNIVECVPGGGNIFRLLNTHLQDAQF